MGALAIVVPLVEWVAATALGGAHTFNDFHDYYFAAKLITEGHSPYDLTALADIARREGATFLVGSGYSYPLPFAFAMLPFTLVPFTAAVLLFNGLSLVLFGGAVALWLRSTAPATESPRLVGCMAILAGAYPPIYGTIAFGQANLIVVALLAVGLLLILTDGTVRPIAGGVAVGLAAVVKLVPGIVVLPLAIAGRLPAAVTIVATMLTTLVAAIIAAPFANAGSLGLFDLVGPDSFFTNQSINGFVSRLVRDSDRTLAVAAGAFDPLPVAVVLAAAFGTLGALLVWRARGELTSRHGVAVGVALAIVTASIAAPKNSFWNQAALLVPVGLLIVADGHAAAVAGRDRLERLLLGTWVGGALVQQLLWAAPPPKGGPLAPLVTLGQSAALYGALALWLLFARRAHALASMRMTGAPRAAGTDIVGRRSAPSSEE